MTLRDGSPPRLATESRRSSLSGGDRREDASLLDACRSQFDTVAFGSCRSEDCFVVRTTMVTDAERPGLQWQVGEWDEISRLSLREMEPRFVSVVENVISRGDLKPGGGQHSL